MKKVILFLVICGTLNIVQASPYPEKVNNDNPFNKYENFRGIYNRIYEDVNNEDLVEVCERTLRWPEFWEKRGEKTELIYSVSNCKNFHGKNEFSESFLNTEIRSNMKFNTFSAEFKDRFEGEKDLLRMENNSKRRTGLASIFTDGTEDQKSSPFDVISSLNNIDKTFFGKAKSEKPVYEYTKNKLTKNTASEDNYLIQTEENLPTPEEDFAETTNISGALWKSGTKVLREELNPFPLWLTRPGKHMGDAIDAAGVFSTPMLFTAETHDVSPLPTNDSEAEVSRYSPLSKLKAFNAQSQFGQSAFATEAEQDNKRVNQLEIVLNEKDRQQAEIQNSLFQFEKGQFRNYEEAVFESYFPAFRYIEEYTNFFKEGVALVNEEIFPPLFLKPIFFW